MTNYDTYTASGWSALTNAISFDGIDGIRYDVFFNGQAVGSVQEILAADGGTVWEALNTSGEEITVEVARIDAASVLVTELYGDEFTM